MQLLSSLKARDFCQFKKAGLCGFILIFGGHLSYCIMNDNLAWLIDFALETLRTRRTEVLEAKSAEHGVGRVEKLAVQHM